MMTDLSVSSIVALFDTNKEQRQGFVRQVVNQAIDGNVDMLKLHKQVKAMEEIVKAVLDDEDYKQILLDEALKHGKTFDYRGDKWQVKEAGAKYHYENCNDPYLNELMEEKKYLDKRISDRQEFLKSLKEPMTVIIESTGEIVKVHPPAKTSTTTVALKMT